METITNHKYAIQGVHRLKLSNRDLIDFFKCEYKDISWIVTTEKKGSEQEHTHFYVLSNKRSLNVYNVRKAFKGKFQHLLPETIKNGIFNISKV